MSVMNLEEPKTAPELKRPHRSSPVAAPPYAPLVSAQRGKFATLPEVKLESLVAAQLHAYCAFVEELEGTPPETGAVISAGLEMLFAADTGFARWQQEQRKTYRPQGTPKPR